MTVTVLVIPSAGDARLEDLPADQLEALQGLVGGWIEPLTIDDTMFIMNEDGKMQGLPPNGNATAMVQILGADLMGDILVGQVVLVGATGGEQLGSVPDHTVTTYRQQVGNIA
jgi:hypothetical protein